MSTLIPFRRPAADAWEWQLLGSCRGLESTVFFHPDGERGRARAARVRRAKQICHACPVLDSCRNYALAVGEPYGVWGGMSEDERRTYARWAGDRRATN
ncbi:WhiB family transcriptional regulator [Nocardia sp. NPDC019395]|uniref:WhiB family transcriptional regulator n=1 Tax=Nocardia sp. NPDC019395 TaxID=3154686 RepID=UPI0033D3BEEF